MKVKFNDHPAASCYMDVKPDGAHNLVSYTTTVITLDCDGWLEVRGLYSRTTIKHIGWFMKYFGFTYQLAKQLYLDGKRFNIYTGEVQPV
jgi:hypothetical protein